jgi:predicted ATPase
MNEDGFPKYQIGEYKSSFNDYSIAPNNIPFFVDKHPTGNSLYVRSHKAPTVYPSFVLVVDLWDDFGIQSLFQLFYHESDQKCTYIGSVKILNESTKLSDDKVSYYTREYLADSFSTLDGNYCSLGQSKDYYNRIKREFPTTYPSILLALRDCAIFPIILEKFENNFAFKRSLLRTNEAERILRFEKYDLEGKSLSSCQSFFYDFRAKYADEDSRVNFTFDIDNVFPQRVMAIVGKNGVGKTQLITSLPMDMALGKSSKFAPQIPLYSKVIAVSNSLYDQFKVPKKSFKFNYVFCGLTESTKEGRKIISREDLMQRMITSAYTINARGLADNLRAILSLILPDLMDRLFEEGNKIRVNNLSEVSKWISSGESSLLYLFLNIVSQIRYDSLLLFDEPETHLHPNAITALMSSIYKLLDTFQSYAIIATHSPLIIREMRANGVRIMTRVHDNALISNMEDESLGANISSLVDEIFENKDISKYYRYKIKDLVNDGVSHDDLIRALTADNRKLGIGLEMFIMRLYQRKGEKD